MQLQRSLVVVGDSEEGIVVTVATGATVTTVEEDATCFSEDTDATATNSFFFH